MGFDGCAAVPSGAVARTLSEPLLLPAVVGDLLMGRRGGRLASGESVEGPCALVRVQERMRSVNELDSGEVSFIDGDGARREGYAKARSACW